MNGQQLPVRSSVLVSYVLILLGIGWGIYLAGDSIEYEWRWDRIPQYVISTEGGSVIAPFVGQVEVDPGQGRLLLREFEGERSWQVDGLQRILVASGDLVFEGELLARTGAWRAGPLLQGMWMTLLISAVSLVFAVWLGLVAGLARVSAYPLARWLASTYIEVVRGTPLLVQIFIVYFFIGTVLSLSAFAAGVVALSVFTGAYVAEIVRAGIEAVPRGQMEAARSLGMSKVQAMRHVILPQALKKTLPPLAGQFINLIKDSSLVSVMALTDLTKAGREVVSSTFAPFEVWFTVAALYLVLTGLLSWLVRRLELRMAHD